MNRLFIGCAVALTLVNSFSAMHADEPPPAMPGAVAQAPSPTNGPVVLKPGVWTNISPVAQKIKDSKRRMFTLGFAIDPQNPATIYVCVKDYELADGVGLYKTTDSGANWKRIGPFDAPGHVIIDPKDSKHLYGTNRYTAGRNFAPGNLPGGSYYTV